MMIRAAVSPEKLVDFYYTTRHCITEECILHSHHCENLKFHKRIFPKPYFININYNLLGVLIVRIRMEFVS